MSHISNIAPPQSYLSIEGKAQALREMLAPYGVTAQRAFPIVEVLEHVMPAIMPEFYLGAATWEELDGAEAIKTPDNKIMVRDDVYEAAIAGQARARFTLAHELGHLMLHQEHVLRRMTTPSGQKVKVFYDPEWQADAYASAVLMPRQSVSHLTIDEIVSKFRVSRRAAEVRMDKIQKYR